MTLPHSREGRGRALVLSNSLGTRQAMWEPLLPHVRDRFDVIRYDLPGHSGPSEPFGFRDMVTSTIQLLDALSVRDAVFAGVSVGGAIGVAVAAARPDLVADLVVVNSPIRQASREFWTDRAAAVERDGLDALAQGLWARWFDERTPEAEAVVADFAALDAGGYAAACRALADLDVTADATQVAARTLIVAALDDVSVHVSNAAELAAAIHDSTLWRVVDGGHLLPVRRAALVGGLIRAFADSGTTDQGRR